MLGAIGIEILQYLQREAEHHIKSFARSERTFIRSSRADNYFLMKHNWAGLQFITCVRPRPPGNRSAMMRAVHLAEIQTTNKFGGTYSASNERRQKDVCFRHNLMLSRGLFFNRWVCLCLVMFGKWRQSKFVGSDAKKRRLICIKRYTDESGITTIDWIWRSFF